MNKLTAFLAKHFITQLLQDSYRDRSEKKVLQFLFKTILTNQQSEFREDNEITTVDYILEQLVKVSKLKPSWDYYQKLRPDDQLCPVCNGTQVMECGCCECRECLGTGIIGE
jgi:hypothetical protein